MSRACTGLFGQVEPAAKTNSETKTSVLVSPRVLPETNKSNTHQILDDAKIVFKIRQIVEKRKTKKQN
jgi:hypothetical protein